jgi:hypothetical protein
VTGIGLRPEDYGTHSLRRTKASIIYQQTGNLRAVQILLGHTKIESTVRYLGVDVEDALALAEGTEVLHLMSSSASASRNFVPRSVRLGCAHPRRSGRCPLLAKPDGVEGSRSRRHGALAFRRSFSALMSFT